MHCTRSAKVQSEEEEDTASSQIVASEEEEPVYAILCQPV